MKYSTPQVSQLGSIDDQDQGSYVYIVVPGPMNVVLFPIYIVLEY